MISRLLIASCLMLIAGLAHSQGLSVTEIKQAQNDLKATFSNFSATNFQPSPIKGLFEVHTSSGIVYFDPLGKHLIFGHIYSHEGENLTEKALAAANNKRLESLPMDSALVINKGGKIKLIEFTDPDCGYCAEFHRWAKQIAPTFDIEYHVFFLENKSHPLAKEKFAQVFCSKNPDQAIDELFGLQTTTTQTNSALGSRQCEGLDEMFEQHAQVAQGLGIQATPSFLLDGKVLAGFRRQALEAFFIKQSTTLNP